jgi:hypothetical protein
MKDALECLEIASQCEEVAEAATNETNRAALQNVAAKWRALAEEAQRSEDNVETPDGDASHEAFSIHAALQADGPYVGVPPS